MSKKFGKFLLFSAIAGAAAYGAYYYLKSKDKAPVNTKKDDVDDDYDDFNEELDEDISPARDRSYVSLNLDKAEAFASEAIHKAKEVFADSVAQVKETVKSVAENQASPSSSFTDITDLNKKNSSVETIEEFFDDTDDCVDNKDNEAVEGNNKETLEELEEASYQE